MKVFKKKGHHPLNGRKMRLCKLTNAFFIVACKVFGSLIRQLFPLLSSSLTFCGSGNDLLCNSAVDSCKDGSKPGMSDPPSTALLIRTPNQKEGEDLICGHRGFRSNIALQSSTTKLSTCYSLAVSNA